MKEITTQESTEPLMKIENFAEQYRLKIRRDSFGDPIIPGKFYKANRREDRNHIYEHGDGRFGVYLTFPSARRRNARRREALAAGFTVNQNADWEGTLLFDPENPQEARLAIRRAGVKRRRIATPEHIANLAKSRARPRDKGFGAVEAASLRPDDVRAQVQPRSA